MNQRKRLEHIDRREFLRLAGGSAAVAAFGAYACTTGGKPGPQAKPNILYLMSDQHRYDCVGANGNPAIHTPNLDRIAAEGVRFCRAYTSTPSCTPARSGILTGLSPWHHGMLGYGRVAKGYEVELPREVRKAGYYTFGIGKMHWFPQRSLHGFHATVVDESGRVETADFVSDYRKWFKQQAPDLDPDATGIGWNSYRAAPYALPEDLHPTFWTGQRAVDFIEKYDRAEPFMLKVSFARPHSPYEAPARFWEMYLETDLPRPVVGKWAGRYETRSSERFNIWHGKLDMATVLRARRGYYGSVSFIDEQIGRILDALERRGMLDNTLIVYFGDHGDMLGDHNMWRKTYAYESSARIPMLLRWPRPWGMHEKRNTERTEPVELRDILPTFLDAAGAPIPEGLDGRSMLELVRGNSTNPWREYLDLEHYVCYSQTNDWNAMVSDRFKYVFHACDGSEQLFDLHNDPHELEDLSGDSRYSTLLHDWRAALAGHFAERGEPYLVNGRLAPRPGKSMLYSPNYPGAAEV